MHEPPLFAGPVPKKRRTGLRSAARQWPSAFDSRLAPAYAEPEDSVLSDEAEVALALAGLASAASWPGDRVADAHAAEEEAQQADEDAGAAFQRRRKPAAGAKAPREPAGASYLGPSLGAGDGILPGGGSARSTFTRLAQPGPIAAKPEPIAGPREPPPAAGDAPARPSFKRCASHVYIARFIEYQTNKSRLQQQAHQWNGNGFGAGRAMHHSEPEPAEPRLPPGTNGAYGRQPPHTLPEQAAALPHSQELPSLSGGFPFLGLNGFPGAGAGPGLQLPPAYAHLLAASQQQQQQPGAFPFLPPGQQLGLGGQQQQQQQAALAQALAGASCFFSPYSMQLLNGGLAQQLAAMAGLPVPSGAPSPSLPLQLPIPKQQGHSEPPKLPNGAGLKQEELPRVLAGLQPGALAGVDLERLRAMLPPGFLEQRAGGMPAGLGDALAALKAPGPRPSEQLEWGPNGLPARL